jgi:hypothetical protein
MLDTADHRRYCTLMLRANSYAYSYYYATRTTGRSSSTR